MANQPDLERAKDYVVRKLERELSPSLTYHGLVHTIQEVIPAAEQLATLEKVGDEDRLLILTAAYFHDLGFIRQRDGHEAVSILYAEAALPTFGYSQDQIAVIRGIIRATCLPQSPTNLLERIMADADLDYLGHEDYWRRSNDFRQELENYGRKFSDEEWCLYQLNFMQAHSYFTESERILRDSIKQEHIMEVKRQLEQIKLQK
ncbi:MAG: hypothetical protein WAV05_05370 [Anaerolineales bacterium]